MSTHSVRDSHGPRHPRSALGWAPAGLAVCLALFLSACGGGSDSTEAVAPLTVATTPPLQRPPVPLADWRAVLGLHVLRNADDWQALWERMQGTAAPVPVWEGVDLGRHMLLGISALGTNGCSTLRIMEVLPEGKGWLLRYRIDDGAHPDRLCTDEVPTLHDVVLWPSDQAPVRAERLAD